MHSCCHHGINDFYSCNPDHNRILVIIIIIAIIVIVILILILVIIIVIIVIIKIVIIIMFPMNWIIHRQPRIIQQASYPVGLSFSHPILSKLVRERNRFILFFFILLLLGEISDYDLNFPTKSTRNYVNQTWPMKLSKFTICFWMQTEDTDKGVTFSYAIPGQHNEITIFRRELAIHGETR